MRFQPSYFCIALILFILEVCIATILSPIPFIRGSIGDVLVVMLLYYLVLAFIPVHPVLLAFTVFVFACSVEAGQYFQFTRLLGLERQSLLSILLGNTFSWIDMGMYLMGSLAALILNHFLRDDLLFRKQNRRAI